MSAPTVEPLAIPPTSTPWVPVNGPVANLGGGFEIGYDQITAPVNITATTQATATTVIPGTPHTFDGNPVMFEFHAPWSQADVSAGSNVWVALYEGSTWIAGFSLTTAPTNSNVYTPLHGSMRYTPSAGVHTYSVKAYASLGTSAVIGAQPGGSGNWSPAYLRATSVAWYSGPGAGIPSPVVNGQWVKGAGGAAIWASVVSTRQINASGANLVLTPPVGLADAVWLNPSGGSIQNIDPTGLANGTTVTLWNWAGTLTTIQHMGGTGRLWLKNGANALLSSYDTITFVWDAGLNLWIEVSRSIGAGDGAWTNATLLDNWTNYGGGFQVARFRKLSNGMVTLQGLIHCTGTPSANSVINLPAGYRPSLNLIFTCSNTAGQSRWDVRPDGSVIISTGDSTGAPANYTSLSTIQFYADQ